MTSPFELLKRHSQYGVSAPLPAGPYAELRSTDAKISSLSCQKPFFLHDLSEQYKLSFKPVVWPRLPQNWILMGMDPQTRQATCVYSLEQMLQLYNSSTGDNRPLWLVMEVSAALFQEAFGHLPLADPPSDLARLADIEERIYGSSQEVSRMLLKNGALAEIEGLRQAPGLEWDSVTRRLLQADVEQSWDKEFEEIVRKDSVLCCHGDRLLAPLATFENDTVSVGVCSSIGARTSMEDDFVARSLTFTAGGERHELHLVAALDGHGGREAVDFVKEHLPTVLIEQILRFNSHELTELGWVNALKMTPVVLDAQVKQRGCQSGTTATIAVVYGQYCWILNIGDSRAMALTKQGGALQLSEDAVTRNQRFLRGVVKRNGFVIQDRVAGCLEPARTIGDWWESLLVGPDQSMVTARPKIVRVPLARVSSFVLTTDGLTFVASTQQIIALEGRLQALPPAEAAKRLVQAGLLCDAGDNALAVVMRVRQRSPQE